MYEILDFRRYVGVFSGGLIHKATALQLARAPPIPSLQHEIQNFTSTVKQNLHKRAQATFFLCKQDGLYQSAEAK